MGIKAVYTGQTSPPINGFTDVTLPAAVDMTKTFVKKAIALGADENTSYLQVYVHLISSTQVRVYATSGAINAVRWQVIENY